MGSVSRRRVLGAMGFGAAGMAGVALWPGTAAGVPLGRGAVLGDNEVDLYVVNSNVNVDKDGLGTLTSKVGNYGPNATVGPVRVLVVTPFWGNIVRGADGKPPEGFTFLNENKQPNIPEILEHVITDPIEPKTERVLQVPISRLPGGPRIPTVGRVIVHVGKGSGDNDKTLDQNVQGFTLRQGVLPPEPVPPQGKNEVDLYWVHETIALGPEESGLFTMHVGNAGPNPTTEDATLVVRMPFYVNIDEKVKLPSNVSMVYQNKDPEVPEIVSARVSPGLQPGVLKTIKIPLRMAAGAPSGYATAAGIVTPRLPQNTQDDPKDFDSDYSPNLHRFVVVSLSRSAWS
jgi:hypothetical protein